ncbi:MAG: M16 family metallopeptidase [Porticoccaceae bacterium]
MAHQRAALTQCLANGLELHTRPIAGRHTAAVALWWRAGRLHEDADASGAAHLLEHLVCEALPTAALARWGGAVNGQSGREWTVWHALLPAAAAPEFLTALARVLRAPLPPAARIAREARVLGVEIDAAASRDRWEHSALAACFGTHPLARPLAVPPRPDHAGLANFRERLLTGPRLQVTAAGNVDPQALAAAIRSLGELPDHCPSGPVPPQLPPQLPSHPQIHRLRVAPAGALWLLPFARADAIPVAWLADLLAHPLLGRLTCGLRTAATPLYGLHSALEFCADIGLWWLWIDDEHAACALEAAVEKALADGFTATELTRVRALRRARQVVEREDLIAQLEVLAGARPADTGRQPPPADLLRVLARCWNRRCRVQRG